MYNSLLEELNGYWVHTIMVDKEFQGKGIGKIATKSMISEIAKLPNVKKIVGYHPENLGAKLYSSLGFIDNGDRFGKLKNITSSKTYVKIHIARKSC
ncbi:L-amino acid N-acyltransferase YncA [Cytobacillus purgationiresistens]|uniref:L-amino acid N-acyltransferase YncA n=1 Tax=Cytobacillus purgationiresistens TaxID=863449 RepID=A0ABU0ARV9_9BACI|nr:L-amino acid N-acyltransferase YncA [Cytobacillus purgationiresistens]